MKLTSCVALLAVVGGTLALSAGHAETPEEWIKLGARVHGGFGAFIPAGIRIGLDALARLKAEPRGVTVTFYTGEKAPCPCIADGVMGARSGRALRGGHGRARTIRCRGCPVTGCSEKATHLGRLRRTLTQGLATGDGLISFGCPVTGVSS